MRVGIVFGYHVFSCFLCGFTRVENFGLAKGDWSEGEVAADEEQVGDAQGSQQVVEHTVHLSGKNSLSFGQDVHLPER